MAAVTVRNLPKATHRALKLRAAENGRSTEAEIREILETAVRSEARMKIGSELAAFAQKIGGLEFELPRDAAPVQPAEWNDYLRHQCRFGTDEANRESGGTILT